MTRQLILVLVGLLSVSAVVSFCYESRLETRLNQLLERKKATDIGALPYQDLLQTLLDHQVEYYREPIKSLNSRLNVKQLNGAFDFCFDPKLVGFKESWYSKSLGQSSCALAGNFHRIPVPSAFNDILSDAGAMNYMGWFWYQTSLTIFDQTNDTEVFLQFESINYFALVYVQEQRSLEPNTTLIGSHVGGHLPLTVKLDGDLLSGRQSDGLTRLRLTIAVSNMLSDDTIPSGRMIDLSNVVGREYKQFQPDFDFFHYAGILGDVSLIHLPRDHIVSVRPTVQRSGKKVKSFEVCVALEQGTIDRMYFEFEIDNLCKSGTIWHKVPNSIKTKAGVVCLPVTIDLSSMEHCMPTEKTSVIKLVMNNGRSQVDVFDLRLEKTNKKLFGPDEPLYGFGMHQEQFFSGRTMSLAAIMKDVNLLRKVGANVIRTSHYPYSPHYLDACDEHGIMVIAECPAVGLNSFSKLKLKLHKQILKEMMVRDQHHPSIIMWSVANEPQSQSEMAREYFESLLDYARNDLAKFTIDAQRPLTAAIAQAHDADKIGHLLDVIMVNRYYAWYEHTSAIATIRPALLASLIGWASKHPGKPLMISEYGADTLPGLHSTTGTLYSEEFQRDLVEEHEKVFDELLRNNRSDPNRINFIGSMIWNFADFSTHESLRRVGGINRKGIFTRTRDPKLAVEIVKSYYKARASRTMGDMEICIQINQDVSNNSSHNS